MPRRSATSPPIPSNVNAVVVPPPGAQVARANTVSPPGAPGMADPVGRRMMSPPMAGAPLQDPTGRMNMMSPPMGDPAGRRNMMSPPAMGGPVQLPGPAQGVVDPIGRANTTSPPFRGVMDPVGRRNAGSPPLASMTAPIDQVLASAAQGGSQPIPRANFAPTVHTVRPRSRSFSGMASSGGLSIRTEALSEKRCAPNRF